MCAKSTAKQQNGHLPLLSVKHTLEVVCRHLSVFCRQAIALLEKSGYSQKTNGIPRKIIKYLQLLEDLDGRKSEVDVYNISNL